MTYNLTAAGNATHILGLFTATNDASGGFIGSMVIISTFVIILFSMLRYNPVPESFTGASTVTTVAALILMYVEVVSVLWVLGCTILWGMSAIALYKSNSA